MVLKPHSGCGVENRTGRGRSRGFIGSRQEELVTAKVTGRAVGQAWTECSGGLAVSVRELPSAAQYIPSVFTSVNMYRAPALYRSRGWRGAWEAWYTHASPWIQHSGANTCAGHDITRPPVFLHLLGTCTVPSYVSGCPLCTQLCGWLAAWP